MKIIFWNMQNASVGDKAEDKDDILTMICARGRPDIIVLCEVKGHSAGQWERAGSQLGYNPVPIFTAWATYKKDTTYRHVVLANNQSVAEAWLVETGTSRPALAFRCGPGLAKKTCMAFHTPSVANSTAAQRRAVNHALECLDQHGLLPQLVFGDFNVDAGDPIMLSQFLRAKKQGYDCGVEDQWKNLFDEAPIARIPDKYTRPKSMKKLDWLLSSPGEAATCQVFEADERPTSNSDSDSDWDGMEGIEPTDQSDHEAIVIRW